MSLDHHESPLNQPEQMPEGGRSNHVGRTRRKLRRLGNSPAGEHSRDLKEHTDSARESFRKVLRILGGEE